MKPVERNEILGLADYEQIRAQFRARVIEEKKRRRFAIGPNATAVFENHDTVLLQIQEMLRTERITKESSVLHELEVYNQLIPRERELSATLMFEIPEKEEREAFLFRAEHIEKKMYLLVGEERLHVEWDRTRESEGRTSAVHYLKIPLTESAMQSIRNGKEVFFEFDHDAYRRREAIPRDVVRNILEDLD